MNFVLAARLRQRQRHAPPPHPARRVAQPFTPDSMSDSDFESCLWFSKRNVQRIADMLELDPDNNRGRPLSGYHQVALALNCMAGNSFQRITGLALSASQSTVHRCLLRVTKKLVTFKEVFIQLPTYAGIIFIENEP